MIVQSQNVTPFLHCRPFHAHDRRIYRIARRFKNRSRRRCTQWLPWKAHPVSKPFLEHVQLAGKITSIEIAPAIMVRAPGEIDAAFAAMKKEGAGAVVVQGSLASKNTAELALKHGLPSATFTRSFAEAGGLMSYGTRAADCFGGALYSLTRFCNELVVNLKTAKALGLTVPKSFLARADELIE